MALDKFMKSKLNQERAGKKHDDDDTPAAVALSYDPADKDSAPVVLASGQGDLADKIAELAKEHDIPIYKDPDLVALLAASDVGDEIPVEAFIAVAEILKFIYEKNGTQIPSTPSRISS